MSATQILCTLSQILCCEAKCSATNVASMLAFHPPNPPSYSMWAEEQEVTTTTTNNTEPIPCRFAYSNGRVVGPIIGNNVIFEARLVPKIQQQQNSNNLFNLKYCCGTYNNTTDNNKSNPSLRTVPAVIFKTTTNNNAPVILFAHGNAVDLGGMIGFFAHLCAIAQVHVVGFEYTGYGQSIDVKPHANLLVQDALITYELLVKTMFPNNPVILYGQSLGSVPICQLATMKSVKASGVILHSPLANGLGLFFERPIVVSLLCCCNVFKNSSIIRKTKSPVFIIHGRNDEEIPFRHAIEVYNAIPRPLTRPPLWVENAGHNDIINVLGDQQFFSQIKFFIDEFRGQGMVVSSNYSKPPPANLATAVNTTTTTQSNGTTTTTTGQEFSLALS
jgi:pimeloyl-ACP methyl ester carboxylesterase